MGKKLLYAIVPLTLLIIAFDCTQYVIHNFGHRHDGTHTDDCAFYIDCLIYVVLILCTIFVIRGPLEKTILPSKAACSICFYICLTFTSDVVAHIGLSSGDHDHHFRDLADAEIHAPPKWLEIASYVMIGVAFVNAVLWAFVPSPVKASPTLFCKVEVFVVALIFLKGQYLLRIFLIDLEWALNSSKALLPAEIEHLAHTAHVMLARYEMIFLGLGVVEILFYSWAMYAHGHYLVDGLLITLGVAVMAMISVGLSGVTSFAFIAAGRTLAFVEVIAATIDANKIISHWSDPHYDGDHHAHHSDHEDYEHHGETQQSNSGDVEDAH